MVPKGTCEKYITITYNVFRESVMPVDFLKHQFNHLLCIVIGLARCPEVDHSGE